MCVCVYLYKTIKSIYNNNKHTRQTPQECCDGQVCFSPCSFDTNCQLSLGVREKKGSLRSLSPEKFPENRKNTEKVTWDSTHQVSNKENMMKTQLGRAIPEEREREKTTLILYNMCNSCILQCSICFLSSLETTWTSLSKGWLSIWLRGL